MKIAPRVRSLATSASGQLVLAAMLCAVALADRNGRFGVGALACVTAAAALALCSARRTRGAAGQSDPARSREDGANLRPWLVAMVAAFLFYYLLKARSFDPVPDLELCYGLAAAALAADLPPVARALARRRIPVEQVRLWLWLACGACTSFLVVYGTPLPLMDVWTTEQEAAAALLRGQNPYSIAYRNIFGSLWLDGVQVYSPAVADAQWVHVFTYPPLTILSGIPGFVLLGDVRYAMAAVLVLAAWALSRLAPAGMRDLAAALVLFHPATRHQLIYAWTEPTVLAPALLMLVGLRRLSAGEERRREACGSSLAGERESVSLSPLRGAREDIHNAPRVFGRFCRDSLDTGWLWTGVAMGIFACSKQYTPLLLAPIVAVLPRARRWHVLGAAVIVLLAVMLPFAVWDFGGLYRGNVVQLMQMPFRLDALTWTSAFLRLGIPPAPVPVAGVLFTLGALVACWPRRGDLTQALACASAAFLVTLITGKQAFSNYYWLAGTLLVAAAFLRCKPANGVAARPGVEA